MPDWESLIRNRIASLGLPPAAEADLTEELAQHLEDRYRELLVGGAEEAEAFRQAVAELDDQDPIRGLSRRSHRLSRAETVPVGGRSGNWFIDLRKDLQFAGRTMRNNPFFVLFVVVTLGLGIGANTTVFTLINTLLLNPLPVPNSSELTAVAASEVVHTARSAALYPISYPNFKDYQGRSEVFVSLAGYTTPRPATLQTREGSERIFVELVTGNYFSTLDLHAAKGRFFLPDEDTARGAHALAVLNYGAWQRRFGGAADIIGRTLWINRVAFTVIGVAPPKFIGVNAIFGPDLWIPASMAEQLMPNEMGDVLTERGKAMFQAVGRLKPGVRRERAQANLETIAAALAREYPEANEGRGATVRPIRDAIFNSASSGVSNILFGGMLLLAVVGIVLLIACSNVANLLLARAAARQHEIAVRLAIGASRGRLIRQLLTESAALGLVSGVAGVVIGISGVRALWSSLPPGGANFITPRLDPIVFVFTLIVSLTTGFAFGTVPALRASRVGVAEALKEEGRSTGKSRQHLSFANALLVGQVAFSFLLLMTAALFLRSIGRAYQMDPGFQAEHLAVFMTNPGQAGYGKAQTKTFYKEVRDRLTEMAGVASVSWASNLPLWGRLIQGVEVEGHEKASKADVISSILNTVDIRYFETAGIPIVNGRDFSETDRADSTPVAIINEKMAHDYWPSQSALGKHLKLPGQTVMRQVVGVARTANYSTLAEPPQACVYVPLEQSYSDSMTLYVRSKGDPQQIMLPVQREVRASGPGVMVNDSRTGHTIMDNGLFQAKVAVMLLSVFGMLALGLASVGLYGIMAYSVHRRTREIGLRMALGAGRGAVLRLILKRGLTLVGIGMGIGFGAALIAGQLLARALYGISGTDPLSVGGAGLLLLAVAFIACYLPALAASRVDPLTALRQE